MAIIANGDDFAQRFKELEGLSVIVTGTRLEGASTRMAGPEIQATSVVAANNAAPGGRPSSTLRTRETLPSSAPGVDRFGRNAGLFA